MCRGNFVEAETGKIDLPDDDPEAVNIMVQHLYGQSYKDARANSDASCEKDLAIQDARVYAIADKYNIPLLKECAKGEFKAWAAESRRTEPWTHVVEEIRKGNEFSGLHAIIEEQVAEDIDQMLAGDWLSFIDQGMKLGRFSAAFLLRIVKKKNDIFCIQRDQNVRQQFQIIDLKNSIKGYKQVIDELGKQMRSDTYDSDESIAF
ncbi:hypothetical protein CNMCM8980_002260 [Aspergillus fumigatiaffinis]|uniref:BTB/POZ domain-containing protein n=1 Tax=Aspergillus fumigatiaffinis TaxID=340414 RepID=A0A8H4HEN1_9EURO|nr:hypothetical protein CNMCM6457_005336 [Aspergillus fumigatiaffinis]KAF4243662.1 hypothetical protein CNMCM6805_000385 [Aspergillus fumigatiaffinis]KAF4249935.1 hypothetical protein CNMCM8980_002260 [Aspergillus fumigatiaffinis]